MSSSCRLIALTLAAVVVVVLAREVSGQEIPAATYCGTDSEGTIAFQFANGSQYSYVVVTDTAFCLEEGTYTLLGQQVQLVRSGPLCDATSISIVNATFSNGVMTVSYNDAGTSFSNVTLTAAQCSVTASIPIGSYCNGDGTSNVTVSAAGASMTLVSPAQTTSGSSPCVQSGSYTLLNGNVITLTVTAASSTCASLGSDGQLTLAYHKGTVFTITADTNGNMDNDLLTVGQCATQIPDGAYCDLSNEGLTIQMNVDGNTATLVLMGTDGSSCSAKAVYSLVGGTVTNAYFTAGGTCPAGWKGDFSYTAEGDLLFSYSHGNTIYTNLNLTEVNCYLLSPIPEGAYCGHSAQGDIEIDVAGVTMTVTMPNCAMTTAYSMVGDVVIWNSQTASTCPNNMEMDFLMFYSKGNGTFDYGYSYAGTSYESTLSPNTCSAASSSNVGGIAGGVVGAIVFIGCVGGLYYWLRVRNAKRTAAADHYVPMNGVAV